MHQCVRGRAAPGARSDRAVGAARVGALLSARGRGEADQERGAEGGAGDVLRVAGSGSAPARGAHGVAGTLPGGRLDADGLAFDDGVRRAQRVSGGRGHHGQEVSCSRTCLGRLGRCGCWRSKLAAESKSDSLRRECLTPVLRGNARMERNSSRCSCREVMAEAGACAAFSRPGKCCISATRNPEKYHREGIANMQKYQDGVPNEAG